MAFADRDLTTGPADVFVVPPAALPALADAGRLAPVPDALRATSNSYRFDALSGVYANKLLAWDRKVYGLPVVGAERVLVYDIKAFADERLDPPDTWAKFGDAAEKLKAGSLPPLPERDEDLDAEFATVAAGYDRLALDKAPAGGVPEDFFSFHFSAKDGAARIDGPAFVKALDVLRRWQPYRVPGRSADPAAAFLDGKAKLGMATLADVARLQAAGSPARDRFAVAPLPGSECTFDADGREVPNAPAGSANRVPYFGAGGLVGCVRADAANKEAAFDLLTEFGHPDRAGPELIAAAKWGAAPVRSGQTDGRNRNRWLGYGFDQAGTERLVDAVRSNLGSGVLNPPVRLRTPNQDGLMRELAGGVRAALDGPDKGTPSRDVLAKVAAAWRKQLDGIPKEEWRATYRKSLGL